MLNRPKPLVLLILDGFGYSADQENNAIATVNAPCWDQLQQNYPMTLLNCSGHDVGLPDDQMGNSGVGPIHIGSGRYVPHDFSKANDAVKDGTFFTNPVRGDARLKPNRSLSDLTPTILAILGIEKPIEMTGKPLIKAA